MPGNEQFGRGNVWASLKSVFNLDAGWYVTSSAPTNGAAGTYFGKAGLGAKLLDSSTGIWYVNLGTRTVPQWNPLGGPVALGVGGSTGGGLGAVGNAKMTYDFASDGGAIGTITPANSPTLPLGAIVLGGVIDITTTLTGAANTTALGFGSGAQAAALKAATAVASYTAGTTLVMIPIFTSATYYKLTAAARMTLTTAAGALTAGRMDVNIAYVQGN